MEGRPQISALFSNAKIFIVQNNPKDARDYILAFVKEAQQVYYAQTGILQKAKTRAFIERWVKVASILREQGITEEVLLCFGLSKCANKSVPETRSINPSSKSIIPEKLSKTTNNIDIDEITVNPSKSQGWAADIFEKYKNAVVRILAGDKTGTGFVISKNGFLLTNEHLVSSAMKKGRNIGVYMSFCDKNDRHVLQVISTDKEADVALCKFDSKAINFFSIVRRIKDYSSVQQGADVLVIGNGFAMGLAPFTGTVKFVRAEYSGNLIYTAPSNPGDSGGPVFNRNGECIGINKSIIKTVALGEKVIEANGMTNATHMEKIDELLQKWSKAYALNL